MKTKNQEDFDSSRSLVVDGVAFLKSENNILSPAGDIPSNHLFAKTKTKSDPVLVMTEFSFSQEELENCNNPFGFQLFSYVCSFLLFGERVNVEYENKPQNVKWNKNH